MSEYVVIVAGGKGLRMGADIPKQFLPIGGRPVLMRTIERFRAYSSSLRIILVLPQAQQDYWHQLCRQYEFDVDYQLTNGGETRFHSVQNGLALIPVVESVRRLLHDELSSKGEPVTATSVSVDRSDYRLVQTPQVFDIQLLKAANRQPYRDTFTDDASVVESYGQAITLVEGNRENIKITTPFDLQIAEALIRPSTTA